MHRRHLNESQRGLVAARLKEVYASRARDREESGKGADGSGGRGKKKNPMENLPQGLSARDEAGAALNVSGKTVDHAAAVLAHGSKDLVAAVERVLMTVWARKSLANSET